MVCPKCDGTGSVLNPKLVGAQLRYERVQAGASLRAVARAYGKSAQYLSKLEWGEHPCTPERVALYRAALATAQEAQ